MRPKSRDSEIAPTAESLEQKFKIIGKLNNPAFSRIDLYFNDLPSNPHALACGM